MYACQNLADVCMCCSLQLTKQQAAAAGVPDVWVQLRTRCERHPDGREAVQTEEPYGFSAELANLGDFGGIDDSGSDSD